MIVTHPSGTYTRHDVMEVVMERQFQQYELDAYLGDFAGDFDVEAIVGEVTYVGSDGNRYWRDLDGDEFLRIVESHEH